QGVDEITYGGRIVRDRRHGRRRIGISEAGDVRSYGDTIGADGPQKRVIHAAREAAAVQAQQWRVAHPADSLEAAVMELADPARHIVAAEPARLILAGTQRPEPRSQRTRQRQRYGIAPREQPRGPVCHAWMSPIHPSRARTWRRDR